MPRYRITHHTCYRHSAPATAAWQSLHLQPRREETQHCTDFTLEIAPAAGDVTTRPDFFGNTQHFFSLRAPHTELHLTSRSLVVRDAPPLPAPGQTPPLAEARARVGTAIATGAEFHLEQFLQSSAHVSLSAAAAALAAGLDADDPPALAWLAALGARFAAEFTFDPEATTLATPITEVLEHRRGVCQDFAHLFLSCVRQHGLPAAYVSGYLLTSPPPGQPRLRGADASHAWVSVYVPGAGWIDYDPTNTCFAGDGHIVVARGRDYADVSPVRGLFSGGGSHTLTTGVTVEPADDPAP